MSLRTRNRLFLLCRAVVLFIAFVIIATMLTAFLAPIGSQAYVSAQDDLDYLQWIAVIGVFIALGALHWMPTKEERRTLWVWACFTKSSVTYLQQLNVAFVYPTQWWPGQSVEDLLRLPTALVFDERDDKKVIISRRSGNVVARLVFGERFFGRSRWSVRPVS